MRSKHCCDEMTEALTNSPDKYRYDAKGDVYMYYDCPGKGIYPIIKQCDWCNKKLPNDLKKRIAANPTAHDSTRFRQFMQSLREEFCKK